VYDNFDFAVLITDNYLQILGSLVHGTFHVMSST